MLKFAIFILASLLLVTLVSADSIHYGNCPNTDASTFTHDVQWVTRTGDTSAISYAICASRASDLRYANNLQISVFGNYYSRMKITERIVSLCPNGATSCSIAVDTNRCIRGTLTLGIPLPSTNNGIKPRSEIVLSEGSTGGIALLRACSL